MRRFYATLLLNLIVASALAFLTIGTLHSIHHDGQTGSNGWLILSPLGALTGMMPIILLLLIFLADSLWALFFVLWILKKVFHIKSKDKTSIFPSSEARL
jgi:hypothetical protein